MGQQTDISWCHHTWNPWSGCTKISEGCEHCYAASMAARFKDKFGQWGDKNERLPASEEKWAEPLKWNRLARKAGQRRRVFCASMADVFDELAPEGALDRLWDLIDMTPDLDWLLLTKRPQRAREIITYARPNVWLGCTMENQKRANERMPHLLATPAVCRFVSAEPLLGYIDFTQIAVGSRPNFFNALAGGKLHWIITGGESGPGARVCWMDWIGFIATQAARHGVSVFVKQTGSNPVYIEEWDIGYNPDDPDDLPLVSLNVIGKGDTLDDIPADLRIRQFPEIRAHVSQG